MTIRVCSNTLYHSSNLVFNYGWLHCLEGGTLYFVRFTNSAYLVGFIRCMEFLRED